MNAHTCWWPPTDEPELFFNISTFNTYCAGKVQDDAPWVRGFYCRLYLQTSGMEVARDRAKDGKITFIGSIPQSCKIKSLELCSILKE